MEADLSRMELANKEKKKLLQRLLDKAIALEDIPTTSLVNVEKAKAYTFCGDRIAWLIHFAVPSDFRPQSVDLVVSAVSVAKFQIFDESFNLVKNCYIQRQDFQGFIAVAANTSEVRRAHSLRLSLSYTVDGRPARLVHELSKNVTFVDFNAFENCGASNIKAILCLASVAFSCLSLSTPLDINCVRRNELFSEYDFDTITVMVGREEYAGFLLYCDIAERHGVVSQIIAPTSEAAILLHNELMSNALR